VIKIDLHTHSIGSPDGGIKPAEYKSLLESAALNYIAVTDHDTIDLAVTLRSELGENIIVGQEITTSQGELIGLFLTTAVPKGLSAKETALAIRKQNGLVYVPHPFETVRKGVTKQVLDTIAEHVDIVEVHNGRAFMQNKGPQAVIWARLHSKAVAASSDAHGKKGIGTCFTTIQSVPTAQNLVSQLNKGHMNVARPPLSSLLYPKYNRLHGKIKRKLNKN
jgi:predicted metal-dependent phosphoesterase TrpH